MAGKTPLENFFDVVAQVEKEAIEKGVAAQGAYIGTHYEYHVIVAPKDDNPLKEGNNHEET